MLNGDKYMKNQTKQRESNMELLRILAMFFIIMFHIVFLVVYPQLNDNGHFPDGVAYFDAPQFNKKLLIPALIMPLGNVGNDIFLLISGYFMAVRFDNKKENGGQRNGFLKYKTPVNILQIAEKLLLSLAFATVLLVVGSTLVWKATNGWCHYLLEVGQFNEMAWYIGYYFAVILLGALFLNYFLTALTYRQYKVFLIILLALTQFTFTAGILDTVTSGRTLCMGVLLYSLGGFVRKYDPFEKIRCYVLILIMMSILVLTALSYYNYTMTRLSEYIQAGSTDLFLPMFPLYLYSSIVPFLVALCLFELFRRIHIGCNRIINFIGASTFMTYLIHNNDCFNTVWDRYNWAGALCNRPFVFIERLCVSAAGTFAIGILTYALYFVIGIVVKNYINER